MITHTNSASTRPSVTAAQAPVGRNAERDDQAREDRRRSREIERHSPEGRPAHPEYRSRDIGLLFVGVGVALLVASVIVSLTVGVLPGLIVLVFGFGLAVLLNPEIWATSMRAKERYDIEHEPESIQRDDSQAPR